MSDDEILVALESAKCMDAFECIFCMYGMNEDGVYGCFAEHPDGKPGESKGCVAHQAAGAIRLLKAENAKLRELVCHLWYVKPRDVTSVLVEGEMVDLEELMESVGLRWEDA